MLVNLHFWLDKKVHVVRIQVGALVSSADAETHSLLGPLPIDPLGPEREGLLSTTLTHHHTAALLGQPRLQEGLRPLTRLAQGAASED